jgi:hypothetical protein
LILFTKLHFWNWGTLELSFKFSYDSHVHVHINWNRLGVLSSLAGRSIREKMRILLLFEYNWLLLCLWIESNYHK